MANIQPIKKEREADDEPVNISDRAMDNLRYIRDAMERSTSFTAVPGYGGILMGVTAIGAAYIANGQIYLRNWLVVWITEAVLAASIGLLAMWQKSKIAKTSLVSVPARKFAMSFAPAIIVGAILTLGLWRFEHYNVMAGMWMLLYGVAVINGGTYSVKAVPVMGWCFLGLGAITMALPKGFGDEMMALSFGLLHIIFGFIIARRYGG
ncbi:MAG: hypothetical protein KF685_07920 [Acidobacteria bacterium]|nr:hypothetical protein [Acidobacteriota bacterium]